LTKDKQSKVKGLKGIMGFEYLQPDSSGFPEGQIGQRFERWLASQR
jgi:hypothetical protein